MPRALLCVTLALAALLMPQTARAQAAIAGTVRDPSGSVLPGVSVQATSPALIERVRSGITDGAGQYRIVDLRPGTYEVTFTMGGFKTIRRTGIHLEGNFTAPINVALELGARSETLAVAGESPAVDVVGNRQTFVVNRDMLERCAVSARSF